MKFIINVVIVMNVVVVVCDIIVVVVVVVIVHYYFEYDVFYKLHIQTINFKFFFLYYIKHLR